MAENRELACCSTCKQNLPLNNFHRGPKKNGRTSSCKSCMKIYAVKWCVENRERTRQRRQGYMKAWHDRNKEHSQNYQKEYTKRTTARRSEVFKAWYAKNIQRQRAKALSRRNNNVELARAKCRAWLEKNKVHRRQYAKINHIRIRSYWQRRRARARAAEGFWRRTDIERLFIDQSGRCAYCLKDLGADFHVDHVTPLSKGGSNWPSNLALACPPCNWKKSARTDMKPFLQVSNG